MTLYRVGTIKHLSGLRCYVAVDGGMSDNPRPVLYGSGYEAFLPAICWQRQPLAARLVGKHCESGDVIVDDARLPGDLAVGDIVPPRSPAPMDSRWLRTTTGCCVRRSFRLRWSHPRRGEARDDRRPARPRNLTRGRSLVPVLYLVAVAEPQTNLTPGPDIVHVGLLGYGNVGVAFTRLIDSQAEAIALRTGLELRVTRIAVRDLERERPGTAREDAGERLCAQSAALVRTQRSTSLWSSSVALNLLAALCSQR